MANLITLDGIHQFPKQFLDLKQFNSNKAQVMGESDESEEADVTKPNPIVVGSDSRPAEQPDSSVLPRVQSEPPTTLLMNPAMSRSRSQPQLPEMVSGQQDSNSNSGSPSRHSLSRGNFESVPVPVRHN